MPSIPDLGVISNIKKLRFFSSPSRSIPLVMFLIYAALFSYYYFHEAPRRQQNILDHDLDMLASTSDQILSRIQNLVTIVQTQMEREKGMSKVPADELNKQNLTPGFDFEDCHKTNSETAAPTPGSQIRLYATSQTESPLLHLHYRDDKSSEADRCGVSSIKALAEPFLQALPYDAFDDLALLTAEGDVLYHQQRTAIRMSNLSAVLEGAFRESGAQLSGLSANRNDTGRDKNKDKNKAAGQADPTESLRNILASLTKARSGIKPGYSAIFDFRLADHAYKLLFQPVPIFVGSSRRADNLSEAPVNLGLIGIIDATRLAGDARRLPPAVVVNISGFLLLALVLLWAVLKVWQMGPAEGFRPTEVLYFALSLLAAAWMSTTLILYDTKILDYAAIDTRLSALADRMDTNLQSELDSAIAALRSISQTDAIRSRAGSTTWSPLNNLLQGRDQPKAARIAHLWYPWLDQMFWTNEEGLQIIKWSIRSQTAGTRQTKVAKFPWFKNTVQGTLWTLKTTASSPSALVGADPKFTLDVLYSVNTGEYLSIILQPARDLKKIKVMAVSTPLVSLNGPIMPPNYGFAVIDENGKTLFHSEADKNSREILIEKVEPATALRSIMFSRFAGTFNAQYQGRTYRMYARPFTAFYGSPWTLVTFHDLTAREHFYLYVLGYSLLCNLGFFVWICILIGGAAYVVWKKTGAGNAEKPPWYRPTPETQPAMILLSLLCGVLLLGSWRVRSGPASPAAIWACCIALIPLVGLGAALVLFGLADGARTPAIFKKRRWLGPPYLFVITATLLLTLFAVFPAIAFFRLSFDYARVGYRTDGQIRLAQDLQARVRRLTAYYREVRTDSLPGVSPDDAAFLTRRIRHLKLDRYDLDWSNDPYKKYVGDGGAAANDPLMNRLQSFLVYLLMSPQSANTRSVNGSFWAIKAKDDRIEMSSTPAVPPLADWEQYLPIASDLPQYAKLNHPAALWLLAACVAFGFLIRHTLFTRFGLRYHAPAEWPAAALDDLKSYELRNTLITCPPNGVDIASLRERSSADDSSFQVHSLKELLNGRGWKHAFDRRRVVIVHQFEFGILNPEHRERTRELVDDLVADPDHSAILISAADPLYYMFEHHYDPKSRTTRSSDLEDYARWMNTLNSFVPERVPLALCRMKPADWHSVWNTCALREKLVLRQIAEDGMANPNNEFALTHLWLRSLVGKSDDLFVIDPALRTFVKSSLPSKEVDVFVSTQTDTAWHGVKRAISLTLFAIPIFIGLTWSEFWDVGVGQIVTVGSAGLGIFQFLPQLFSLLGSFRAKTKA